MAKEVKDRIVKCTLRERLYPETTGYSSHVGYFRFGIGHNPHIMMGILINKPEIIPLNAMGIMSGHRQLHQFRGFYISVKFFSLTALSPSIMKSISGYFQSIQRRQSICAYCSLLYTITLHFLEQKKQYSRWAPFFEI